MSNVLLSQEEVYIESENIPDTYIGEFNKDYLFYSKKKTLIKNKEAKILKKEGDNFVEKFNYVCLEDERIIDVFTEKGSLYILSDIKDGKNLNFTIKELDVNFHTVFTKVLFSMNSLVKNKLSLTVKHEDNALGIICVKKMTTNEGFVSLINLENKEVANYKIEVDGLEYYTVSDIVFNSNLESSIIIEGFKHEFSGIISEEKSKVFVIKCSNQKSNILKVKSFYEDVFCKSYKFCKIDDESYLIGSMVYKKERSELMEGYSLANESFGLSELNETKIIYNKELNTNPKYWMPKDFEQIQKNKFLSNSSEQRLVKIVMNYNDVVFVSESQYKSLSGAGTSHTIGSNATSTTGGITGGFTYTEKNEYDFIFEDIIFTKINIKNYEIEWTNKTINRFDDKKYVFYYDNNSLTFNYFWNENNFILLFDVAVRNLDISGVFSPKDIGVIMPSDMKTTAGYLINDDISPKLLSNNYIDLPLVKYNVHTLYLNENNKYSIMIYESKKPALQAEIKKYRMLEFK